MQEIGANFRRTPFGEGIEPAPASPLTHILHGGDLGEASALFPHAPRPWIDLSTGINPVPYPLPQLPAEAFCRLPSPADRADLEAAAAEAYGVGGPAAVVSAPGTQMLIDLLPRLRQGGHVAVVGATYAEHAHGWRKAGHAVEEGASLRAGHAADVVVVVNPNNPDGRVFARQALAEVADRLACRGGLLVVDEAFADLEDVESLAAALPPATIVLRSFGKAYGLAGIRLGFAIAPPDLAFALHSALGPWAVSGPAIAVGRAALRDRAWRDRAAQGRAADARRLDDLLRPVVDRIVGGTKLYRLVELGPGAALFEHLGRHGIWARRFRENSRRLRFGLPGSEAEWRRLELALRGFGGGSPRQSS